MKNQTYVARLNTRSLLTVACCLLLAFLIAPVTYGQTTPAATPDFQSVIARQASLVTEFEVNGLKGLVKRREGSQTVAAGLFIRAGGATIRPTDARREEVLLHLDAGATA